ncbi:MAG: toxin-antitoxin system HicB family antitoxin [Oscillospiraceae bacterium]|nr:toxin-antitoxin system HicB family antitoxin [Oscillospiraceae bacterium]
MHKEAAMLASRKGISLNAFVEKTIYDAVNS